MRTGGTQSCIDGAASTKYSREELLIFGPFDEMFLLDKYGRCVHCGTWLGMIKW